MKLPDSFVGVPILAQVGRETMAPAAAQQATRRRHGKLRGSAGGGRRAQSFAEEGRTVQRTDGLPRIRKAGAGSRRRVPDQAGREFHDEGRGLRSVQMLGNGKIGQNAAQAAAWHLNNDMGWNQLGALRVLVSSRRTRTYFSRKEVEAAKQAAAEAIERAKERKKTKPAKLYPGDSAAPSSPRLNDLAGSSEKGDRHHLPERPGGCCAQMVPVPFFAPGAPRDVFEASNPGRTFREPGAIPLAKLREHQYSGE